MEKFLGNILNETLGLFKRNYKRPKLWIIIIGFCLIFVLLIPYIDANFFYYNRMEKRIAILDQVMKLDPNALKGNDVFNREYQSILNEISQNEERSINSVMNKMISLFAGMSRENNMAENRLLKFFTGALWFIILTICIPFMNTFKKKNDKIVAFFAVATLAFIIGLICMNIPIIITPIVNYISIPLLQLTVIIVLAMKSSKKE